MKDLGDALAAPPPPAVIYSAKEIVTLDPTRPSVAEHWRLLNAKTVSSR